MQPFVRRLLFAAVSLLVILMPVPALAAPSIAAAPDSALVGATVTVTGLEFISGFECTLHLGASSLSPGIDPPQVGTCTVNGDSLSGSFTVPSFGAGGYTLWACNGLSGNLCIHEFEERASTPFTITPPPTPTTTATTQAPITTPATTQAPITTTATTQATATTTTSTTFPEVIKPIGIDFELEELPPGFGLGEGLYGPSIPLSVGEGGLQITADWLVRCGPLSTSTVWSFDDQMLGGTPEYPPHAAFLTEVVQPDLGTISLPYAARQPTTPGGWNYRFDAPIRYFGVHVGLPEATEGVVVIQIEAATLGGTFDADRVVLGPDQSPASTCLLVQWPEGVEDRPFVKFRVFSASGRAVDVDFDDVFFGTDQFPRSFQPEGAEVRFLRPRHGDEVRTARPTVLLGEVRWPDGLEIDGVRILRPTWDGSGFDSALAEITRSWLMSDGSTRRALFWLDGVYVAPGENEVWASAFGPGVAGYDYVLFTGDGEPTPPPDVYRAAVTGLVDIRPWAMEVTQAVRGPLVAQDPRSAIVDDFNHVAGRRTVLRAYGTQQFATGDEPDVVQRLDATALLYGTRGGATLPGSPLRPSAPAHLFGFSPGGQAEDEQRPYLSRSWNFVLPAGWTAAGDVVLRLEVNPAAEAGHIEEAAGTDGANNFITQSVRFTDVGTINLNQVAVDLYYRCDAARVSAGVRPCGSATVEDLEHAVPSSSQMQATVADAWKMMPVPGAGPGTVTLATLRVAEKNPPVGSITRSDLGTPLMSGWLSGLDYDTVQTAYGDLSCPWDLMIFHTSIPWPSGRTITAFFNSMNALGRCKRGAAWLGEASALVTVTQGDVFAHEIGHALGLFHTPGHDEADARARWAGDHGEFAQPGVSTYGLDTSAMVVISSEGTHDLMSYGPDRWISVGTWDHLFDAFVANAAVTDSRTGGPAGDSDVGSRTDGLIIAGSVEDSGEGSVPPPQLARGIPLGVATSEFQIQVRGFDGSVLAAVGALVDTAAGTYRGLVPAVDGAASIVVLRDGELVDEIVPALVDIDVSLAPLPDLRSGPGRIEWSGPEGGNYLVEASLDGDEWWPLGRSDLPRLDIDPSLIPLEGDGWTIRVQSTDGVRVVSDEIGGIDLGLRPPVAHIISPQDSAEIAAGMVLAGAGTNPYVKWEHSWFLDGDHVGSGPQAMLPLVAPGNHEITLVVDGEAGRAESSISVTVFVDADADGMADEWESAWGLDPGDPDDGAMDPDGDGLVNAYEHRAGSDPNSIDSDGDDYADGVEVQAGSDPTDAESRPVWLGFEEPVDAPRLFQAPPPAGDDTGFPWAWLVGSGGVMVALAAAFVVVRRR